MSTSSAAAAAAAAAASASATAASPDGGFGGAGGVGSHSYDMNRVDLHEMIRLDQVENILNSLLQRINVHDTAIQQLQSVGGSYVSRSTFERYGHEVKSVLTHISERVSVVEEASTATIGDEVYTAGELSVRCHEEIQKQGAVLTKCVDQSIPSLQADLTSLAARLDRDIDTLDRQHSAMERTVSSLEHSQVEYNVKLEAVENSLLCKVDKSQFSQIEALASRLEHFASFQHEVEQRLRSLEDSVRASQEVIDDIQGRLQIAETDLEHIQTAKLPSFANADEVQLIATELLEVSAVANQCASMEDVEQLTASHNHALRRLDSIQRTSLPAITTDLTSLSEELQTKAASADVLASYVLRDHFDEIVAVLGDTVETKAPTVDVREMHKCVQDITTRLNETSSLTAVCVRFIEWFSQRGESYEYNIGLIDKHLENLVTVSHPAHPTAKQPFKNTMRFTPGPGLGRGNNVGGSGHDAGRGYGSGGGGGNGGGSGNKAGSPPPHPPSPNTSPAAAAAAAAAAAVAGGQRNSTSTNSLGKAMNASASATASAAQDVIGMSTSTEDVGDAGVLEAEYSDSYFTLPSTGRADAVTDLSASIDEDDLAEMLHGGSPSSSAAAGRD